MSYTLVTDLNQETVRCILVENTDTYTHREKSSSIATVAHRHSKAALPPTFLALFI